jgi:3-deoxy-D-manno-octulosonate 8-phosphate phosphatase (KDO 8-P phosphatase)
MIELIVLDVDGTLTNGDITYDEKGIESKTFDVKDGLAIATWTKKLNKKAAIITGRKSNIVEKRAKELGVTYLYQNIDNKDEILEKIRKKENLSYNQIAIIGDDLNDIKMLQKAGLSFCPQDAVPYIKKIVHKVCQNSGGNGAVRNMIDHICFEDNIEEDFIKVWIK